MRSIRNTACRMCRGTELRTVINFGRNPLVNNLLEQEDLGKPEPTHPLVVKQCQKCFLLQITHIVDPVHIYQDVDYVYFSSDMPTLREYYAELATDIKQRFVKPGDLFVEIGSNDGIMLNCMRDVVRVLGVDPATNVVLRALKRGLPTVPSFFSERLAKQICFEWGKARVILGANCIAHLNDIHEVMRGAVALLEDDGVFIVEANYWGGMVEQCNYALIYHDHFSYFTLKNWVDFAPTFGLQVFDAVVTESQGSSLRVFMGRGRAPTQRFRQRLLEELSDNLNSYDTARRYSAAVRRQARRLGGLVRGLKAQGRRIAAYGAAAKGLSALRVARIDQRHIDYFVDDSPAKQGKYTPITHIPIISRKEADAQLPDYFLITAASYEEVIVGKEAEYQRNGGRFLTVDGRILGGPG